MSERICHQRGCDRAALFLVIERYEEETGQGTFEAEAALCAEHTAEERPHNLDQAGPDYLFSIEPLADIDPSVLPAAE